MPSLARRVSASLGNGEKPMVAENRICHSLSTMPEMNVPARNVAELLCDLGFVLRWRMRRGAVIQQAPLLVQSLRWDSQMALQFVNLSTSDQLRAMVEDWPLQRIQEYVQAQRQPDALAKVPRLSPT